MDYSTPPWTRQFHHGLFPPPCTLQRCHRRFTQFAVQLTRQHSYGLAAHRHRLFNAIMDFLHTAMDPSTHCHWRPFKHTFNHVQTRSAPYNISRHSVNMICRFSRCVCLTLSLDLSLFLSLCARARQCVVICKFVVQVFCFVAVVFNKRPQQPPVVPSDIFLIKREVRCTCALYIFFF